MAGAFFFSIDPEVVSMQKDTQLNIRINSQVARQIRVAAALRGERLGDFLERVARSEIANLERALNQASTSSPAATQEASK
jgi:uncharacterized protein (DUF1778 family)